MQSLPVEFSAQARSDLYSIFDGIVARGGSPMTAAAYIGRIEARCRAIGHTPEGVPVRLGLRRGIRLVAFERSAMIGYVIEAGTVVIARVFYRGRNYLQLLRE